MSERYYQETSRTYDTHSGLITDAAKSAHITYLPKFIKELPHGSFVVDLGCGSGRDARQFMDAGMNYLGVDFSLKTIEIARRNSPYARFEHKDVRALMYDPETVEAFWAPDVLYHLAKADFKTFVQKAYTWLKPGGHLFMIMKLGTGEGYISAPAMGGMYYSYYSKSELEEIVVSIGYSIVESKQIARELIQASPHKAYGHEDVLVLWLKRPEHAHKTVSE